MNDSSPHGQPPRAALVCLHIRTLLLPCQLLAAVKVLFLYKLHRCLEEALG